MTIYYDNGEVYLCQDSGEIALAVTVGSGHYETATLTPSQARDIAAALVKAADEKEASFCGH